MCLARAKIEHGFHCLLGRQFLYPINNTNAFVVIGRKVFIELVDVGALGHGREFFQDNKDRKQMLHALTHEQVKDHLI